MNAHDPLQESPRVPLDPEVVTLLDSGYALPYPQDLDAGLVQPQSRPPTVDTNKQATFGDALIDVTDRFIDSPWGQIATRWYQPKTVSKGCRATVPCIMYLHGGGWVSGDLDMQDSLCRELTYSGQALVVSVNYRLAPQHPYPAAIQDALHVLRYIHQTAEDHGVITNRVSIAGSSAGANLVLSTLLADVETGQHSVRAQLLIYPPVDPTLAHASVKEMGHGCYLTREHLVQYYRAYLPEPSLRMGRCAAPLYATNLNKLPVACIATAGYDPLRDEGLAFISKLEMSGVQVVKHHFPDLPHGFIGMANHSTSARKARDRILESFQELI